jgi:hypothetical protein
MAVWSVGAFGFPGPTDQQAGWTHWTWSERSIRVLELRPMAVERWGLWGVRQEHRPAGPTDLRVRSEQQDGGPAGPTG